MKKIPFIIRLFGALLIGTTSCSKNESSPAIVSISHNQELVKAKIAGIAVDENNHPVQGANVTAYGLNTITDQNGTFILNGVIGKDRAVIQLSKIGYLKRLHAFKPTPNTVNYIHIVLEAEPVVQIVTSATGGTITVGTGGSVQFQPNSFVIANGSVPYSGAVSVSAKLYSTSDPNFGLTIPGGDLAGKNISGSDVSLYSYGMMYVVLKGTSGELLQLGSGKTAAISIPIASSQFTSAPQTIPLWYLDEITALWKEEGQAVKVGNNYVGNVAHFSAWNCDYAGPMSFVNGRVVDCYAMPLANIIVTINGYNTVATDQNGNFSTTVPAGWALTFQVLPQGFTPYSSQLENIGPLSMGQTATVPALAVPCATTVSGELTGCSGIAEDGVVCVFVNGVCLNYVYTQLGNFNLDVPGLSSVTLTASTSSGYSTQVVSTGANGSSVSVGVINICSSASSTSFGFTIEGGALSNEIVNAICSNNEAYYFNHFMTHYHSGLDSNIGTDSVEMDFPGTQTGSIDLPGASGYSFRIWFGAYEYHPSTSVGDHFMLNVNYYGSVGDSISGTFFGKLVCYNSPVEYQITNGHFAVLRGPDR